MIYFFSKLIGLYYSVTYYPLPNNEHGKQTADLIKMDFDSILLEIGDFGKYQKLVIYLVLLPAVLPCSFHAYSQLFMAAKPDHWCKISDLQKWENENIDLVKNISIPTEMHDGEIKFSECHMYDYNYSDIVKHYTSIEDTFKTLPETKNIIKCKNGWLFDKSVYKNTVITEWNLVCSKDFYGTLGLVLFGVGGIIGNYIFGYLQDGMGRRLSFFIYLLIECIFGIATAFAQNFGIWVIFRIGVGFTVPAILATPYVLAIELVGPRRRTLCTIVSNIAYSLGLVLLAVVVYLVRDWRNLALATTLPFICFFFFWWLMPESPRWLLARGRYDEADRILKVMARVNGKSLPANYMIHLKRQYEADRHQRDLEKSNSYKYGVRDLFRTPNLRKKTLIITFIWFTNTSVYVGLSYYAPVLGGNEFLNFFLAGAVELPTYLFLWPSLEQLGRRWTLCLSMVVGGTACLATFLVQDDMGIMLTLYCVGKMGISSAFVVLPLMASELYPTVVRGLGMSISSVVGMLGPIFIPLVNYLGADMMILPLIIMGVLLVVGGIASLLLPETLHKHLPQTLEDGEEMGLDMDFCCQPPSRMKKSSISFNDKVTESKVVEVVQLQIHDNNSCNCMKQCDQEQNSNLGNQDDHSLEANENINVMSSQCKRVHIQNFCEIIKDN